MELEGITQVMELAGNLGFSVVFLWLFVREMRFHEETRREYRKDLREIAGLRIERESLLSDEHERERLPLNNRPPT